MKVNVKAELSHKQTFFKKLNGNRNEKNKSNNE